MARKRSHIRGECSGWYGPTLQRTKISSHTVQKPPLANFAASRNVGPAACRYLAIVKTSTEHKGCRACEDTSHAV